MPFLLALTSLLLLSPTLIAQGGVALPTGARGTRAALEVAVVFQGPEGGFGDLVAYDAREGTPLAREPLRDVQLLPIEAATRSELWALRRDVARYRDDLPGASRLVLPAGRGVLYAYRRQVPSGLRYGYLWLRPDRPWRRLGERPGTGVGQADSPYLPAVGVGPRGRSLAFLTRVAAGGDLYELDLPDGAWHLRTADVAPQAFSVDSLWLGEGFGFVTSSSEAWRFDRVLGGQVEAVAFEGGPPAHLSGQAVMSFNRRFVMFTAGPGPQALLPWIVSSEGPATTPADQPAALSPAGFLPQLAGGPYMAVSDDGQLAAWRREDIGQANREVVMTRVPQPQPVEITGDAHFVDTLDVAGAIGFYRPDWLTLVVGEESPDFPGAMEKVDVYQVSLNAQDVPQFENLTFTSGSNVQPFVPGNIEPRNLHQLEDGSLIFHDDDEGRMWSVDADGNATVLLSSVKSLEWLDRVGANHFACEVRRDFQPRPHELYAGLLGQASLWPLDLGTDDTSYPAWAVLPGGTLGVLRQDALPNNRTLRRFDLQAPGVAETFGPAGPYAGPLSFDGLEALHVRRGAGALPSELFRWRPDGSIEALEAPLQPSFVLPAR